MTVKVIQKIRVYGLFLLLILLFGAIPLSAKEEVVFQTTTQEEVVFQTTGNAVVSQFYSYSPSYTNACAGTPTIDSLVIKNQGTLPDTYSITIQDEGAQWIIVSSPIITLNPGEQQEVMLYIYAPYNSADSYEYIIKIASKYDSTKQIEKTLSVAECPPLNVTGYPSFQQSCPCSTTVYVFQVANTGGAAETYTLYLDGIEQAYYDLSEYSITLQPHETKEIYAYIRMACFIYGNFDFALIAKTANSKYTAELPLSLSIQQACYNYNIALGEALVFSDSENESLEIELDFTPTSDTHYVLCQETPAVIPVQIQNPGEIMNEYSLHIEDAEQWISAVEPHIRLTGNQEKITSIVVNTAAADSDTYSFALKVDTLRGDLQTVIPFTIEVQDCTPEGLPAWLKHILWILLGIVILAILVAAYFLIKKSKYSSGATSKTAKTAEAIKKNKKWVYWILPLLLLFILLGIFAYLHSKGLDSTSPLSIGEMWKSVETIFYNWATALILSGVLLLLALLLCFLWFFKFRKKNNGKNYKKTQTAESKESKKTFYEKIKPILKWLWIILLLLTLLAGLGIGGYYLYMNYQEDSQKFLEESHIENVTEEQPSENTTIVEVHYDNETITALQQQLADIQKNITDKDQQITALEIEILKLAEHAAASENTTTLDMYEQQIQELQDIVTASEEQLAALQQQELQILTALGALDEKISAVDTHVNDIEDRITEIEEHIAALQTMIAQLSIQNVNETIINETEKEIEELTEEKNDLEEQEIPYEIEVPIITDDSYETTLIFDVSLSGQIVENSMTRFQRGVEAAERYIQEKGIYNVMIIGKNPIMIHRDTQSRDALRIIHFLRPIDTQSNLGNALYAAAHDFHGVKGRIVLISDMETTDNTDLSEIHNELEENGIDVVFIDITFRQTSSEESVQGLVELVEEEQQSPYFDIESQTAETFQIDIPINSEYTVDLNTYFSDEDNDILLYSAETGEHLLAFIKENLAILTPERDWTGKTTVVFGADDGKGGSVESPALVVNVFTPESTAETKETSEKSETEETNTEGEQLQNPEISLKTYIPGIIIGSIIVLIIGSLIIGAFIKRFQKP